MPDHSSAAIRVRPYDAADYDAVLRIGTRIVTGSPPWFDHAAFLEAVRKWTEGSIASIEPDRAVFVAEDEHGQCSGFVIVARHVHFTGLEMAYVGELAVSETAEGIGVGRALLMAAEEWAAQHGFGYVALDTGADNHRARGFYEHLGYGMESVRLVKVLNQPPPDEPPS